MNFGMVINMKTIKNLVRRVPIFLLIISLVSCVDLDPEPLSFFAPENTFMDKEGLDALLITSRKQIKWEWFGDAFNAGYCETPLVYEYAWSDLSVIGAPEVKEIHNLETQLTPNTNMALHLR